MRILAIADEPSPKLWGERVKQELEGIDLILSAGDLPARYLSYLTCFTSAPIVYVRGNHDDHYAQVAPEGCLCAEDTVVQARGIRILGLGGSMRYRPDGKNMYSEKEMAAPNTSVGADEGRSLYVTKNSITAFPSDCKNIFGRRRRVWRN